MCSFFYCFIIIYDSKSLILILGHFVDKNILSLPDKKCDSLLTLRGAGYPAANKLGPFLKN